MNDEVEFIISMAESDRIPMAWDYSPNEQYELPDPIYPEGERRYLDREHTA